MASAEVPERIEVSEGSSDVTGVVSSPLNATELRERHQRKKLVLKKLEKKLEILDRQIKKCAEAEVSLDEMESGYSAYIKEDLLKRKFVKTWQEFCQLQRVSDAVAIEDSEFSSYEGTPYPEVNRRVQRLLRQDEFPDYIDIVQLVDRCNTKHSLGITAEEKGQLSRKVFKDVGKIMKRSRHRDFIHHFGSHLTDNFSSTADPARKDEDLLKVLQRSMREGEKKMESVVEEFVVKQEKEFGAQRAQEGDSCSANELDEEEQQDEEHQEGENDVIEEGEGGGGNKEEQEEEEEGQHNLATRHRLKVADSTSIQADSPESLVTSTQDLCSSADECPGPSGLSQSAISHISSSSEVVCLDDEEDNDVIILSDS